MNKVNSNVYKGITIDIYQDTISEDFNPVTNSHNCKFALIEHHNCFFGNNKLGKLQEGITHSDVLFRLAELIDIDKDVERQMHEDFCNSDYNTGYDDDGYESYFDENYEAYAINWLELFYEVKWIYFKDLPYCHIGYSNNYQDMKGEFIGLLYYRKGKVNEKELKNIFEDWILYVNNEYYTCDYSIHFPNIYGLTTIQNIGQNSYALISSEDALVEAMQEVDDWLDTDKKYPIGN